MNIENFGAERLNVEYVAELFVRPRSGGAPVCRGPVTVQREIPARLLAE